jgi:ribA/ribD-fused uncharacterized protein
VAADSEPDDSIGPFRGEWAFLSNFFPCQVEYEGLVYASVEHAYQAAKRADRRYRDLVQGAATPGAAKRVGNAWQPDPGWCGRKERVMRELLRTKFDNHHLKRALIATGRRQLVEVNNWGDRYWGRFNGDGANRLGKLLEDVRQEVSAPREDK